MHGISRMNRTTHATARLALALSTMALVIMMAQPSRVRAQGFDSAIQQVFALTNRDRQEQGLPPLRWDPALAAAAQAHADRMTQERMLSHQYPGEADLSTRAAKAGAHFQAIAENIATGPDPRAIEEEWMHSTPHRTNILDPRMSAIGIAVAGRGGSLYAVEDFEQASEALNRAQVEQRFRALLGAQNVDASAPAEVAEQACASHGIPQGARSIVRFQTPDLSQLPDQVRSQIRARDFRRAAVGACDPDPGQASFTTYRIAILFY